MRRAMLAVVLLAGCGDNPPKMDATSVESIGASLKAMDRRGDEIPTFLDDCSDAVSDERGKHPMEDLFSPAVFAPIHGLTASEIGRKAEVVRKADATKPDRSRLTSGRPVSLIDPSGDLTIVNVRTTDGGFRRVPVGTICEVIADDPDVELRVFSRQIPIKIDDRPPWLGAVPRSYLRPLK